LRETKPFTEHIYNSLPDNNDILYSISFEKTYTGYTENLERRLCEHNISGKSGYTTKYRPWTLIYAESFDSKQEAMAREKYFKTGRGREDVMRIVSDFLSNNGAVSAAAEKD